MARSVKRLTTQALLLTAGLALIAGCESGLSPGAPENQDRLRF